MNKAVKATLIAWWQSSTEFKKRLKIRYRKGCHKKWRKMRPLWLTAGWKKLKNHQLHSNAMKANRVYLMHVNSKFIHSQDQKLAQEYLIKVLSVFKTIITLIGSLIKDKIPPVPWSKEKLQSFQQLPNKNSWLKRLQLTQLWQMFIIVPKEKPRLSKYLRNTKK